MSCSREATVPRISDNGLAEEGLAVPHRRNAVPVRVHVRRGCVVALAVLLNNSCLRART